MKQIHNNTKNIGYVILIAGLCIMVFSIVSMVSVFVSGNVPVHILKTIFDTTQSSSSLNNSTLNEGNIVVPLFPMFNALIWFIMAYILLAAGGRFVSIGIKILKVSLPDAKTRKESQIQTVKKDE